MRGILIIIFVLSSIISFAQWDVIHTSGNNGGHRDLYFLNNDTGFVIGNNENGSYVLRTLGAVVKWFC